MEEAWRICDAQFHENKGYLNEQLQQKKIQERQ